MRFCAALRANGFHDREVFALELEVLFEYNVAKAFEVLTSRLETCPEDQETRIRLSVAALQFDRPSLVESDPSRLPKASEIEHPSLGHAVVDILRAISDPRSAAQYAYDLFRRFPDSEETNLALMKAVFHPLGRRFEDTKHTTVRPGCAVSISEDGPTSAKWIVIEDGEEPSVALNEFAPNHPMSKALEGKEAGATFTFPGQEVAPRKGRVMEIRDKLLFRAQECMETWEQRFPDTPAVRRFHGPKPASGETDPKKILGDVWVVLEQHEKHLAKIEAHYRENPVPVQMFARAAGRSVFETVEYLARKRDLPIRCFSGRSEESAAATRALANAERVVIDITGITTLHLLGHLTVLEKMPKQWCITEGTLEEVRGLLLQMPETDREGGTMGVVEGKFFLEETTPEQLQARREAVANLIAALKRICTIKPGEALASLAVEKREFLRDTFGKATAQAIALAASEQAVLWTDDLVTAGFAATEHGVSRIWTHLVFASLANGGHVTATDFLDTTVKLFSWGFTFIGLAVPAVIHACEQADWDPDRTPAETVLAHFGNRQLAADFVAGSAAGTIAGVWQKAPLQEQAESITLRILEQLARRSDGLTIVDTLAQNIQWIFGLDVIRGARAAEFVRAWLKGHLPEGGPIILP